MVRFVQHLCNVIRYIQLSGHARRLTFYSEGRNYWGYLEPLIKAILAKSDVPVCYISSDEDDPGLHVTHPNYRKFVIDEGHVRDWLFSNIETDVFVMTMPDLHQYQVKRSRHTVHYVYVQHSLVSLHMVYRKGAFDHYDTIFCAAPHHIKEIRALETEFNLRPKRLVEHGYGRLDTILSQSRHHRVKQTPAGTGRHILIAPSWGPEGMIESGICETIVGQLLRQQFRVTFRPHPQTRKFAKDKVSVILTQHEGNPLFSHELNIVGQDSLHDSDVMISDWSGAALEYMLALKKPVLYVDVPMKVNNTEYRQIAMEPLESMLRKTERSDILELHEVHRVAEKIEELLNRPAVTDFEGDNVVFNPGESGVCGAKHLLKILSEIERARET